MKKQEQFDAYLQRLDAATNEIATDLKALKEEAVDHISPESLGRLESNISKLEALGTDEEEQVPADELGSETSETFPPES